MDVGSACADPVFKGMIGLRKLAVKPHSSFCPDRTEGPAPAIGGPLGPAGLPGEQDTGALHLEQQQNNYPIDPLPQNEPHVGHPMSEAFENWI